MGQSRILRFVFLLIACVACGSFATASAEEAPFTLPKRAELSRIRSAEMTTSKGTIYFELYPEDAPWHVANFKFLADKGFYRGLTFHLYLEGYIIQGGAPGGNPNGGPGYTLPAEFNQYRHEAGTLGMARRPDSVNPERRSNGSQFHILLGDAPQMNKSYTIFGKVIKGMDVVYKLRPGDRIIDLKVFVKN